jgi:hypothetical protein
MMRFGPFMAHLRHIETANGSPLPAEERSCSDVTGMTESYSDVWSGRALQEGFVDLAFGQCALSPSFLPTNGAELESGFLALWGQGHLVGMDDRT